jgi:predicted glycosyltransferase
MRAENSTYAWVSPLRAKECVVAEGEVLFTRGGGRQGKEQVRNLENAELHTVDINESMGSFGNFMCS